MDKDKRLIWVDMEMTGLNPDSDRVIEIATIVTSLTSISWLRVPLSQFIKVMRSSHKWMSGIRERIPTQDW